MKRIKLTSNLWLDEYIPREMYISLKNRLPVLVGLLDKRMVQADQMLRTQFGPVTINNWWGLTDEQFQVEITKPVKERWIRNESGLRLFGTATGATYSQHLYGRASDKLFKNATAQEVRIYIKGMYEELGITCIEENVNWVHSDTRWTRSNELLIVYP